ncbi:MAG: hypothetical protein QXG98_01960 [Candidatus Micrarchaeia archaeon]
MKSFCSSGTPRSSASSHVLPPKNLGSVSTDSAIAPPATMARAASRTSPWNSFPALGEAGFISAMSGTEPRTAPLTAPNSERLALRGNLTS